MRRRCRFSLRRAEDNLPRESEVQKNSAVLGQHDVAGLEVAMHDGRTVRDDKRACDLRSDGERLAKRQLAPRQPRSASVSPRRYSMTR